MSVKIRNEVLGLRTPEEIEIYLGDDRLNHDILNSNYSKAELVHMYYVLLGEVDNPIQRLPLAGRQIDVATWVKKYFANMVRVASMKP